MPVLDSQHVRLGQAFTLGGINNNCAPVPTRTGFNFVGWQVGEDEEVVFDPGTILPVATYAVDDQITVKAIWEAEAPVVTPPTLASDFWYDGETHGLIDEAGTTTSGTLYYGVSQDPEVEAKD